MMTDIEEKYNYLEWLFCDSYHKLDVLTDKYNKKFAKKSIHYTFDALCHFNEDLFSLHEKTKKLLKEIRDYTSTHNIYSIFSDNKTFQNSYREALNTFQNKNYEASEKQFITEEIEYLTNVIDDFELLNNELKYSFLAKIEFLKKKSTITNSPVTMKKSQSLSNLELVYLFEKLNLLQYLHKERGYNKIKTSKILGKILGNHPQDIRALLSKIGDPKKFGDKQKDSFKEIDTFLNSL